MCEAYKHGNKVTHSLCVVRDDENSEFKILTPCGVCQERLWFWGKEVMVGVTTPNNTLKLVKLSELQPYHWTTSESHQAIEDYDYYQRKKIEML